jgi:predicted O-methyltransferase YrrM
LHNSVVKFGVDPEIKPTHRLFKQTSDDFFADIEAWEKYFDLIFIDGFHEKEQVKRDFESSLRCLNDNGFIVLHDTLPENEEGTIVPRQTKVWWGDVYKFACSLISYDGIDFLTVNFDHGCTVVWKDATQKGMKQKYKPVTNWKEFKKNQANMNITTLDNFYEEMDLLKSLIELNAV